jgi:signal transduction histidine kinase
MTMRPAGMTERLRRGLGVRMRSALAAGVVVAVASVLAGAVLLVTARGILLDNITTSANDRLAQAVTAVHTSQSITSPAPDRAVVQVLNASGTVIDFSPSITGASPISSLRPAPGVRGKETRHLDIGHDAPFRVVAEGVTTPGGPRVVLVAESIDVVDDATEAMLVALLLGMPLLVLVVGAATFLFVGRTLRPVDAMRRRADTITARNLHSRLPVPAAKDEIAALATTMNTMLDRIEAASAAQRRFVADASHELRSPLATIHANADLLAAAGLGADPERSVTRIHTESSRMSRLVDDLLLLARVDDQSAPLRHVDVDLDDLVYAARERIAVERPGLTVTGSVTPVRVTGDPDQLHRALRNLVDNAVRHARTAVSVALAEDDGHAEIVVANDGPAIANDEHERIFERFVRLDDSRSRDGGGSGLGLAIARDIVAAHGGSISVTDVTSGVAMQIRIPT